MADSLTHQALTGCDLPQAWANRSSWTVLDTAFDDGQLFSCVWDAWQRDPHRPRMLHYVGIASRRPELATPAYSPTGMRPRGWQVLADLGAGLRSGFHRILLDDGQVSLTLCIGEVQAMLGQQTFQADTLFSQTPGDKWVTQLLARRSKRGCRFWMRTPPRSPGVDSPDPEATVLLQVAGFQLQQGSGCSVALTGCFNPPWNISTSRTAQDHVVSTPGRCAIIGAGLAGATVAHALAVRGWQVTVFDQEVRPAAGASSLPAGLAVPHVSADDSPRSRLSRSGTSLLMQHARRMLKTGYDWDPTGVEERRSDGTSVWHASACWIKPQKMVQAWLSHPGIRFVGQSNVQALQPVDGHWNVRGTLHEDRGPFDIVVVANALGCAALLGNLPAPLRLAPALREKLTALEGVHGTLSHGIYAEPIPGLPTTPVNGNGCFIPHVPEADGEQWFAGSTFETDALAVADTWGQHAANMARLRQLLPMDGFDLAETLDRGPVSQWSATRCVTHDRLPLVGPVDLGSSPGLWLCAGMGARGLSLSSLCAEWLVARLAAEPLPIEFSLSRSLDLDRVRRQHTPGPVDN